MFLSEFSIFRAGIAHGQYVATGLLGTFVVIAFFGILYHLNQMVFGRAKPAPDTVPVQLPVTCTLALVVAAIPVMVFGIYIPERLHALLQMAAAGLAHRLRINWRRTVFAHQAIRRL